MSLSVKKAFIYSVSAMMLVCFAFAPQALAKSKKGGGGLSKKDAKVVTESIDVLTKKVYAASLFSPEDNEKLIDIKLKLDNAILLGASPDMAPLYFRAGNLYKIREYREHAIDCYKTILENFSETALAPKAKNQLLEMGVTIASESEEEESEEETD